MGEGRLCGMRIGVPGESRARETRVAATPSTAAALRGLGYEVLIGAGAGRASSFADGAYAEAGAQVVPDGEAWAADVVLRINAPTAADPGRKLLVFAVNMWERWSHPSTIEVDIGVDVNAGRRAIAERSA